MFKNILRFALILMFCPVAFGQSVEYHGVFAGINDYPGTENDLPYDVADVQQMSYRLRDYQHWLSSNMTLKLDGDATKQHILDAITAMPRSSGYADLFHYSGHGDYSGIWVVDEVDLSPSDLQGAFGSSYNQYAAYIDACHSGIFPRDMTEGVISSACTVDELASINWSAQQSTYSNYLIQGLTNNAAGSNGLISAEQLQNYAAPRTTNDDPNMHPQLKDNYSGDLVLNLDIYVPQQYSTVASALSAAVSGQTIVISGAQTVSSNLTIPSGCNFYRIRL
ncbi:MAG: caspase family protein [Bacteroidetes bacterium]|nr:caspase family protein [Bacteroidota bacterium]